MDMFLGIILFLVGTFAAFVVATAVIAYLRTFSVYAGIKRLYRISFNIGMVTIAVLVSVMMAQMLAPVFFAEASEQMVVQADASGNDASSSEEVALIEDNNSSEGPLTEAIETGPGASDGEAEKKDVALVTVEPDEAEPVLIATSQLASNGPSFKVWKNTRNGHEYAYAEVENGIPYVYMPNARGTFWYDLNNISTGRESGNIVLMANAGVFSDNSNPLGMVIQNGKVAFVGPEGGGSYWTLVVDEAGNVGYVHGVVKGETASYIDARTGEMQKDKKIASAVYAFVPFILNNDVASEEYAGNYGAYRARQIFCVKQDSYMIITNTGEGVDGGGWNYNDMITVARRRGCISAFNLDGGGSTALAWRNSIGLPFTAYATTERYDPTFIVFTADNAVPSGK